MKRIAICCDGTWNSSDAQHDGVPATTNVSRIHDLLADDTDGQTKKYYEGVGAKSGERARGGALGWGLSENISRAYQDCVKIFEPGDELFLFGFSRGAYTARSLAGFIRNAGVLKRENLTEARVNEAYELYRDRSDDTRPRAAKAVEFRQRWSHDTRIKFIGVWDTVGSLGIPKIGMGLVNTLFSDRWSFHDVELSSAVDFAYHALASDECRGPFAPTLWQQQPGTEGQTLEQVWFAGVHSDVGGGYTDRTLADIPLLWMIDKAAACGLTFDWSRVRQQVKPDPEGPAHDSCGWFYKTTSAIAHVVPWQSARTTVRAIGEGERGNESVASSVLGRRGKGSPPYAPENLARFLGAGGKTTAVRLAP
jgi:uncharacterized protein (DUF2235 family)